MFAFTGKSRGLSAVEGQRVYLREPTAADYQEWASLRLQSRAFLEPWEPRWNEQDLSRTAFRARIRRYRAEIDAGSAFPYFICNHDDDAILGGITIGNIRRGVAQSGQLGYWIGKPYRGEGFMREAVSTICTNAFTKQGLHRLEAACLPNNERSIAVLRHNGFEREGLLRSYLKINGAWCDHVLYAKINPVHTASGVTTFESDI
ncbi:MAG: GNAT family protein [Pseudomonadota bacterium]